MEEDPSSPLPGLIRSFPRVGQVKQNLVDEKSEQVQNLLTLVDEIIIQNGGQPFRDEIFVEAKYSGQVELRLKELTARLEQQLAKEQAARRRAEEHAARVKEEERRCAREARRRAEDEIRRLREGLARARNGGGCSIL